MINIEALYVKTKKGLTSFREVVRADGSSEVEVLRDAKGEILIYDAFGKLIGRTQFDGVTLWLRVSGEMCLYSYRTENGWRYAKQPVTSIGYLVTSAQR